MDTFISSFDTGLAIQIVIILISLLIVGAILFLGAVSVPLQILIAGLIGLGIGLLATFAVAIILSLMTSGISILLAGAILLTLCTASIAAMIIRRKEFLPHLNTEEEKTATDRKVHSGNFLLDPSVLIDGRIINLIQTGFFTTKVELLTCVVRDIYNLTNAPDKLTQEKAMLGLKSIETLKGPLQTHLIFVDVDLQEGQTLADALLDYSTHYQIGILTTDNIFANLVRSKGVSALNINDLTRILQATTLEGQKINVGITELGQLKGEGIGYLGDGTKIIVQGGDASVGERIDVIIDRTLETVGGRIVYATPLPLSS